MIEIDSEGTVNPIFALIQYLYYCPNCKFAGQIYDGMEIDECEPPCDCRSKKCPVGRVYDGERFRDAHVRSIWLTREDGEAYGRSQEHNLGEECDGWIVYCVPCGGELANFLNTIRKVMYPIPK